jgi:hypothetical protein
MISDGGQDCSDGIYNAARNTSNHEFKGVHQTMRRQAHKAHAVASMTDLSERLANRYFDQPCRAPKLDDAHEHAPFHATDERLFKDGRKSSGGSRIALRGLQLCSDASDVRTTPAMAANVSARLTSLEAISLSTEYDRQTRGPLPAYGLRTAGLLLPFLSFIGTIYKSPPFSRLGAPLFTCDKATP